MVDAVVPTLGGIRVDQWVCVVAVLRDFETITVGIVRIEATVLVNTVASRVWSSRVGTEVLVVAVACRFHVATHVPACEYRLGFASEAVSIRVQVKSNRFWTCLHNVVPKAIAVVIHAVAALGLTWSNQWV